MESITLPGQFEAEDYLYKFGMQEEDCSDEGGVVNMAFIESGDWLEYSIDVPQAGTYILKVRTAANALTGSFELRDESGKTLTTVQTSKTGGWQNWETVVSESFELSAGVQRIIVHSLAMEFNLNWFEIRESIPLETLENNIPDFKIFPNPVTDGFITVYPAQIGSPIHIVIINLQGKQVLNQKIHDIQGRVILNTSSLKKGLYMMRIEQDGGYSYFKVRVE